MSESSPPDQAARTSAMEDLGSTLFVEAGAGTGKTTMLVNRVVNLVTIKGAHMDQIAAITFTEAAAAELRDRLAKEFEKMALEEQNERAEAARLALDAAAVTTLHGFARKILADHPFSVGLPPLFDVADESSDRVAFDERWGEFVHSLLEDPAHFEVVTRALSCGLKMDDLRDAALQCHRNWDLLANVPTDVPPAPRVDTTRLTDYLSQAIDMAGECLDPEDLLAVLLRSDKVKKLSDIGGATDDLDLLQILAGSTALDTGRSKGRGPNWPNGGKARAVELLRAAEEERLRLTGETARWVVHVLLGLLATFTRQGAEERRQSGHLVFHDLLVFARDLVRDHPEARAELHRRYEHLLIDEFQDTDPMQAELALYLAAEPGADLSGEWVSLPVPHGHLFFVGDPKQSIYRFRRADIDLFMKVRDNVIDHALQLTTNFRSRPPIVDWINAVFSGMFSEGIPGVQPRYEPLSADQGAGAPNPRGMLPVIVLGTDPIDGLADPIREVQANDVAAAIATMQAEQWLLGQGDGAKPLSFSDVAILVRTRTGLPILEHALAAAGIPYRLESSSLVYQSQEVQHLLAILRAIDDPADAVSVLAALRSPAFGCADDDLFTHRAHGGSWDWRNSDHADSPVHQALKDLATLHEDCWWQSVGAMVNQVVSDRRLMMLALSETRPRESWRRIRFLLDQARLFDETNGGDLRSFLRWVSHQQEDDARVTEAIVPESDDEAVRVVTVHGSKGLEYPVVVLMGLQKGDNTQKSTVLFTPDGPEVRFNKSMESSGYQAAAGHEAEMDFAEQQRLLYVAATRARELLVVSLHRDGSKKAEGTLAGQLVVQCNLHPDLWSDGSELTLVTPQPAESPSGETSGDDSAECRAEFVLERTELLTQMEHPRTVAATGVRGLAQPELEDESDEESLEHDSSVHRRGRAGTAVGRAVHAVLQVIDLATGEGLDALAHAQAVAEGVIDREPEVRQRVQSALDSDVVHQAVRSGRYWREMYVGVPVGERVLEGFIDLLYETPDGLVVVDYKTDRLNRPEDAPSVVEQYRLQGAAYALATEQALGISVADCTFLFLTPTRAVPASIKDLAGAVAEAEAILKQPLPNSSGAGESPIT